MSYLRFPLKTEKAYIDNEDVIEFKSKEIDELSVKYQRLSKDYLIQELDYLAFFLRAVPEKRPESKEKLYDQIDKWLKADVTEEQVNKYVKYYTGEDYIYSVEKEFIELFGGGKLESC